MAKDTKERILMAALDMFSKKGYEGTNIRELAASLELVKSGIYKHYESKEAIWNALLDRMIAYYGEHFGSAEHLPPVPDSLEDFVSMTMRMVNTTIHDEQIVKTRKVLTLAGNRFFCKSCFLSSLCQDDPGGMPQARLRRHTHDQVRHQEIPHDR